MQCEYVEISVLENKGIDSLMEKVIQKSMELQFLIDKQVKDE